MTPEELKALTAEIEQTRSEMVDHQLKLKALSEKRQRYVQGQRIQAAREKLEDKAFLRALREEQTYLYVKEIDQNGRAICLRVVLERNHLFYISLETCHFAELEEEVSYFSEITQQQFREETADKTSERIATLFPG